MAGDHQEVVWPRGDGFPFLRRDFDLTPTVDACALAHEGDVRLDPDLLGGVPQGRVSASEQLLVFLAACVPIHVSPGSPRDGRTKRSLPRITFSGAPRFGQG